LVKSARPPSKAKFVKCVTVLIKRHKPHSDLKRPKIVLFVSFERFSTVPGLGKPRFARHWEKRLYILVRGAMGARYGDIEGRTLGDE
jgi:hypothetical protein